MYMYIAYAEIRNIDIGKKIMRLLKNYIAQIIKEELTKEDLAFSKDPVDWIDAAWKDPSLIVDDNSDGFIAMRHAVAAFNMHNQNRLRILGEGSARVAYSMGDGERVIKVAKNQKGIEQNKLESFAGQDPYVDRIVAKVLDSSEDYSWIVMQQVSPLYSSLQFAKYAEVTWDEMRALFGLDPVNYIERYDESRRIKFHLQNTHSLLNENTDGGCLKGREFLDYMKKYLDRYEGMLKGDIVKLNSWGITSDGCVVLVDYGITQKKFEKLYR